MIDFRTHPDEYRHWRLDIDGDVARLGMNVDSRGGIGDYELKLNSYDLGVDIELSDAVQRLRFEHPEVKAVLIESLQDRVFCAGANITMLAESSHAGKVNFCKFTNETRLAIEDASANSGQRYLAAINGTAAGGGYELAMACDHIILVDDGSASVSLPEVPTLGVLPGTGGLTRLVDKRKVRRDRADVLCTIEEGIKGSRALDWGLVDEIVPRSRFEAAVEERLRAVAEADPAEDVRGITWTTLERSIAPERIEYSHLTVQIDRSLRIATITVVAPDEAPPPTVAAAQEAGTSWWVLAVTRDLDDALLHLRTNEPEIGILILKTSGDGDLVAAHDAFLVANQNDWFVREVTLYLKRTLKRLDVSSRSVFALIEPGSAFVGLLAELVLAADRAYMAEEADGSALRLTEANLGLLPMGNGLSRLETRFWGDDEGVAAARELIGRDLGAIEAEEAGIVTFALDEIDWDDEIRLLLEERARYSPDSLTGMEANLRFAGPETLETKIFGRLSAWQNWIFTRPNASGDVGALRSYGTGRKPGFDWRRT